MLNWRLYILAIDYGTISKTNNKQPKTKTSPFCVFKLDIFINMLKNNGTNFLSPISLFFLIFLFHSLPLFGIGQTYIGTQECHYTVPGPVKAAICSGQRGRVAVGYCVWQYCPPFPNVEYV